MCKTLSTHSITSPNNFFREFIMKTAVTNVVIVLTLMISGGLLAMSRDKAPSLDAGAVPTSSNLAKASPSVELVSSVDWSKIKSEQVSPTF
jgi:hypothetical protein